MTGPSSSSPDPEHPDRRPPRADHVVVGRALLVLVVAFVVGLVLLGVASRPPVLVGQPVATSTTTGPAGTRPASSSTTTTTKGTSSKTKRSSTTTTTVPVAARSAVKVLVANGTSVSGAAAHYSQLLQAQGWTTQTPTNTTTPVSASGVYYASGDQAQADTVADVLGLPASSVGPLSTAVPVPGTTGVGVVVVVGADLAGRVTATTS